MNRSGYTFGPKHPRNALEFEHFSDPMLQNTMRVYFANRGVWDAISRAGPTASFAMEAGDIVLYLERVEKFLRELTNSP